MVFCHALISQAGQQLAGAAFGWLLGSLADSLRRRLPVVTRWQLAPKEPPYLTCRAVTCACATTADEHRPRP
jgi:hypothetical protein